MHTQDPHHNEYLAAAAGLIEQTLPPANQKRQEPAVGDFVSGVTAGRRWQGRVQWISDDGRLSIELDGGWLYVSTADITH